MARVWWLATGVVLGFGMVGILTIGFVLLPVAALMAVVGVAVAPIRRRGEAFVLAGAALAPLYVAWLNRSGPGTNICEPHAGCGDEWSPWPFVAAAVVLFVAGVLLDRWLGRALGGASQPSA